MRPSKDGAAGTVRRTELDRLYSEGGHLEVMRGLAASITDRQVQSVSAGWRLFDSSISVGSPDGRLVLNVVDDRRRKR